MTFNLLITLFPRIATFFHRIQIFFHKILRFSSKFREFLSEFWLFFRILILICIPKIRIWKSKLGEKSPNSEKRIYTVALIFSTPLIPLNIEIYRHYTLKMDCHEDKDRSSSCSLNKGLSKMTMTHRRGETDPHARKCHGRQSIDISQHAQSDTSPAHRIASH